MSNPPFSPPTFSSAGVLEDIAITAIPFELPQGLQTQTGQVYRQGQMRLATGADELIAHRAVQVVENLAYGVLVRLSRVVTMVDWHGQNPLSPDDLGNAFMPDLKYLLELYNALNPPDYGLSLLGETRAIPWNCSIRR